MTVKVFQGGLCFQCLSQLVKIWLHCLIFFCLNVVAITTNVLLYQLLKNKSCIGTLKTTVQPCY